MAQNNEIRYLNPQRAGKNPSSPSYRYFTQVPEESGSGRKEGKASCTSPVCNRPYEIRGGQLYGDYS